MRSVRLSIPTCQRVVPVYAEGAGPRLVNGPEGEVLCLTPVPVAHRLCSGASVAVHRFPDGVELFTCAACDAELQATASPGAEWRLHQRREASL